MVTLHIKVDSSDFTAAKDAVKFKNKFLDQLSRNAKTIFEKNTPVKSGRGRNNYRIIKSDDDTRQVINYVRHLPWVNDGTGIYGARHAPIRPKRARVLHFTWRGREWFLKSVKGQKPKKFVERSMPEVIRSIDSAVVIARKGTLD